MDEKVIIQDSLLSSSTPFRQTLSLSVRPIHRDESHLPPVVLSLLSRFGNRDILLRKCGSYRM